MPLFFLLLFLLFLSSLAEWGKGSKSWHVNDVNRLIRQLLAEDYLEEVGFISNPHAQFQNESYYLRLGPRAQRLLGSHSEEINMTFRNRVTAHTSGMGTLIANATTTIPHAIGTGTGTGGSAGEDTPLRARTEAAVAGGKARIKILQPLVLAMGGSNGKGSRLAKPLPSATLASGRSPSPVAHISRSAAVVHVDLDCDSDDDRPILQSRPTKPKPAKPAAKSKAKAKRTDSAASASTGSGGGSGGGAIDVIEIDSAESGDQGEEEEEESMHEVEEQPVMRPAAAPAPAPAPARQQRTLLDTYMSRSARVAAPSSAPPRRAPTTSPRVSSSAALARAQPITTMVSDGDSESLEDIDDSQVQIMQQPSHTAPQPQAEATAEATTAQGAGQEDLVNGQLANAQSSFWISPSVV